MTSPRFDDPHRGHHRLLVIFVAVVGFASYAGNLDTYFVKDDLSMGMFTDEDGGFRFEGWWKQLGWPTERTWDDIWRPIPALSWALDYVVFGPDPVAFHIGNVLLHVLCCVLLYWLVNRLTRFRNPLAGFFGAMMFAVFPVNPEAVLWLTQRTVLMGLAFSFLAMILFDAWMHRRRTRLFVLAWICVVLGTLSREHALPLPGVFCTMALFCGPARPLATRFKDIGKVIAVGIAFIAAYFACRYAIWGRFTGPYSGYPTNAAYAAANDVFGRFGETVRICLVPGNADWFQRPAFGDLSWLALLIWLESALLAIAVFHMIRSWTRARDAFGFAAVVVVFTFTAWIPVWEVFWVNPNLLNSRSAYHLVAMLVAWLGVTLVDPWCPTRTSRGALARLLVPTVAAALFTVVLQVNLRSWDVGGAQVRGLQEAVVQESKRHGPDAVYVVFETPSEYRGCPTIDNNLFALCQPPFLHRRVLAFPFVSGHRALWPGRALDPDGRLRQWRDGVAGPSRRPIAYYRATPNPPGLRALFGAPESPQGDAPPSPAFPEDGGLVIIGPDGRALWPTARPPVPEAGLERTSLDLATLRRPSPGTAKEVDVDVAPDLRFVFDAPTGQTRWVLHLDTPLLSVALKLAAERNARRVGGRVVYRLSAGNLDPEGDTIPWPLFPQWIDGALPVMWRVEAQDAAGAAIGLSRTSRLVILDAR
ncbi:MAG: hypothetical protein CMJ83_02160 [Planctomycetes bacterium]|nr:hypothetical protein [Planctomycetota bacterium]